MPDRPEAVAPGTYTVAVRTLCEFAARTGDLDLRANPSPNALQGQLGHQQVAALRGAGYVTELPLQGPHRHLHVRGRADGWDAACGVLEEIKTFRGDLARQPAEQRALHWAQARVYGHLLCQQLGLPGVTVALVYFDIHHQQEAPPLQQAHSAAELQAHFEALCSRFLAWADQALLHRQRRDAALRALRFPFAEFRTGQRPLAEAVFKAARQGRCLLAQAPTGIGKTVATLFPALKAMPDQGLDQVQFLTAKNAGRLPALAALARLQAGPTAAPALPLRTLELVARDKSCEHPDRQCFGASCPLAQGFFDKLPAARQAAVDAATTAIDAADTPGPLTQARLRQVALAHGVCPYHLGQELVRWVDVVVGDYNHQFDTSALLHGLTLANGWRSLLLVDEAHNLVDRARAMYSASLHPGRLQALRRSAPAALKKPLDRLQRCWGALAREQTQAHRLLDEPPAAWAAALQDCIGSIGQWLADEPGLLALPAALMDFYFDALQFNRLLEGFGDHSILDVTQLDPASARAAARPGGGHRGPPPVEIALRNLLPAPQLRPRFEAAHASVLFSATLTPAQFYTDTLGLPAHTVWLDVPAPFQASQLAVHLVRQVSTRWADRAASLAPIAQLIARQFSARPGNYLAFFSSFDYLQQAAATLAAQQPEIPQWLQARQLGEAGRQDFLDRFVDGGQGVGFAVLGGSFGEGIDLVGGRLIGAFIATLGLPQVNPVNEVLRQRLQAAFGAGHDYAYLYPGIRKVVQAAGRVIRGPGEQGSVHLIDDRFGRPEVLRLLPAWWQVPGRRT